MRESTFISHNRESWERLEALLDQGGGNPDEVQQLFVKVSGDLSYARTYYPRRAVRSYLNDLVNKVFDSMQTKRRLSLLSKIKDFYIETHSRVVAKHRWSFLLSFSILLICIVIGAISTYGDAEFARAILGEEYVTMTTENINKGDPMAVYKQVNEVDMFMGITVNNIRVAFITMVLGVFGGIGTFYVLVRNAVMVGVFQAFFAKQGLFFTSFLTIWIHGTIEIWSIAVAAAAGFVLGRGVLLPGSYTRGVSMANSAIDALIILLGTVPMFVIAGFLEGFVTRMTGLPTVVKVAVIALSFAFLIFIYFVLPSRYARRNGRLRVEQLFIDRELNDDVVLTREKPFSFALAVYRKYFAQMLVVAWLPVVVVLGSLLSMLAWLRQEEFGMAFLDAGQDLLTFLITQYGVGLSALVGVALCWFIARCNLIMYDVPATLRTTTVHLAQRFYVYAIPVFIIVFMIVVDMAWYWTVLTVLFAPWPGMFYAIGNCAQNVDYSLATYRRDVGVMYNHLGRLLSSFIAVIGMGYLVIIIFSGFLGAMMGEMIGWVQLMDNQVLQATLIRFIITMAILLLLLPFAVVVFHARLYYEHRRRKAIDLDERFQQMTVVS